MELSDGRAAVASGEVHQFLTFRLANEQYGVEILKVQEIKGFSAITPIPHTPPHVKGAMNLRGSIIPVVDLRVKFALAAAEFDKFTVIVIVRVGSRTVGLVVDAVSDVLDIPRGDIQPAPDLGTQVDVRFIAGVAHAGDHLVLLLDLERVLCDDELATVEVASPAGAPADQHPA